MTYKVHNRLGSGGFAVEATLELSGLPYEMVLLPSTPDTPLPAEFAAVNPWRQVPVLETPEGRIITETAAILFYLSDRHEECRNGTTLRIGDTIAFYRWTVFMAVNIYEGILRISYPDRYFANDASGGPTTDPDDAVMTAAVRTAARRRVHDAFLKIEAELQPDAFVTGPALSPADFLFAMLYAWHNKQPDLPKCTWITEKVASHEQINPIWHANFGHRLDEKWHDVRPLWA